uniref:(northern house mosquito) hypothetical protein n=1 Tax=Culex pipiens TaxID=7175 RepID=A0A8D8JBI3_CULPI
MQQHRRRKVPVRHDLPPSGGPPHLGRGRVEQTPRSELYRQRGRGAAAAPPQGVRGPEGVLLRLPARRAPAHGRRAQGKRWHSGGSGGSPVFARGHVQHGRAFRGRPVAPGRWPRFTQR